MRRNDAWETALPYHHHHHHTPLADPPKLNQSRCGGCLLFALCCLVLLGICSIGLFAFLLPMEASSLYSIRPTERRLHTHGDTILIRFGRVAREEGTGADISTRMRATFPHWYSQTGDLQTENALTDLTEAISALVVQNKPP